MKLVRLVDVRHQLQSLGGDAGVVEAGLEVRARVVGVGLRASGAGQAGAAMPNAAHSATDDRKRRVIGRARNGVFCGGPRNSGERRSRRWRWGSVDDSR